MTVEALLIIIGLCLFCIYFVFEYQRAAVPPYQEPLKPEADMVDQWVAAAPVAKETLEPTTLNPKAAWPFPHGDKP
jgi:hypothetical protein